MKMNELQRVNEEELDWDDDVSVLNGTPFSGIAYMLYPDGALEWEVTYHDGFKEGLVQEFHSNGKLKREWLADRGRTKGARKEWDENGNLKSEGVYEFGVELEYSEWTESGEQIVHRTLDPESDLAKYVQQQREARIPQSN